MTAGSSPSHTHAADQADIRIRDKGDGWFEIAEVTTPGIKRVVATAFGFNRAVYVEKALRDYARALSVPAAQPEPEPDEVVRCSECRQKGLRSLLAATCDEPKTCPCAARVEGSRTEPKSPAEALRRNAERVRELPAYLRVTEGDTR